MHPSPGRALFLSLAAAAAALQAQALTITPPSFKKLVAEADVVVDGTVETVRTGIERFEGRPVVYTYVSVRVADALKGAPPEIVELRILGGTVGDLTVHVPGLPRFEVGDRQILFVVGNGRQFCPLVGIGHGAYPILERGSDGAAVVLRHNLDPLRDVRDVMQPLDHEAAAARRTGASDLSDTMTVAEFKRSIREEVAHAREE